MKQIRHRQSEVHRVVHRGAKFYVQFKYDQSTREHSGWDDIGFAHDNYERALMAMYERLPLVQKAA